jgi:hypothetical protein
VAGQSIDFIQPEKIGAANGVASLDESKKQPVVEQPDRVLTTNGERPVGKGELFFNPRDFGAIGQNNLADANADTAGWKACLAAAAAVGPGFGRATIRAVGTFVINDSLTWNLRVRVEGPATLRSVITDATKYLWLPTSDLSGDPLSPGGGPVDQRVGGMHGIVNIGNRISNGIRIGRIDGTVTTDKPAHLSIVNSAFRSFAEGIRFGINAYMVSLRECVVQNNATGIRHLTAANSGERLVFENCDISGNDLAADVQTDQAMHFEHCSFSYNKRQIVRAANPRLFFENCHIEMNSPYAPWFELGAFSALAQFTDCRFLIGPQDVVESNVPTSASGVQFTTRRAFEAGDAILVTTPTAGTGLTTATAYYVLTNSSSGLVTLSATKGGAALTLGTGTIGTVKGTIPTGGYMPIVATNAATQRVNVTGGSLDGSAADLPYFSTGPGVVVITGTQGFNNQGLRLQVNDTQTLLRDGHFLETALVDDIFCNNAQDTVALTTEDAHSGTQSMKIVHVSNGTTSDVYFYAPISRGARVNISLWQKIMSTASTLAINVRYAHQNVGTGPVGSNLGGLGISLGPILASSTRTGTATPAWAQFRQPILYFTPAPLWATHVVLQLKVTAFANAGVAYIDDVEISEF